MQDKPTSLPIKLHGFGPIWGLPDVSVFVSTVDAYLRMTGIAFERANVPFLGVRQAPKGKLPFIDDGAARIADSGFIIEYLKRRYGDPLDADLAPDERAIAHAFNRMAKEHLYWGLVQLRWRIDANWEAFMHEVLGNWRTDPELAQILPVVRKAVNDQMYGQGLGRHTIDEVWKLCNADVSAVAAFLADKPFALGTAPSSLDATLFSMLAQYMAGLPSPVREHIVSTPNLVDYVARMQRRYYGDAALSAPHAAERAA
jgi:isoprene-epoxide---glutathione S-transferase